jgi:hypothetical protein
MAMDQQKVHAVLDWLLPRTMHVVQASLGMTGYYRRIIQDYVTITTPLMKLLRKEAF